QEHEVLDVTIAGAPELRHDPEPCRALDGPIADGGSISVPTAPQERVQVPTTQTAHGFGEPALKGQPTLLAIGDHGQASPLLEPDGILHGAVFDGVEPRLRDSARGNVFTRRNEIAGAKQAADMVCVISDQGRIEATGSCSPPAIRLRLECPIS